MLGIGWPELMIIAVVGLIVIGPEDLPDMFRQMGRFTAKLRSMSREFSRAMDQAAKESGVKDVARDLKGMTSPKAMGLDAVKSAADKFEKWDPLKNTAKPTATMQPKPLTPPPMPATPVAAVVPDEPDDLAEADDDLADHGEPAHGPATQALYDKQAAKAAVIAEQTAKLKAIDDGFAADNSILPPAEPKTAIPKTAEPKKRVTKPKVMAADAAPVVKSKAKAKDATPAEAKAPRKTSKKADAL